MEPCFPNFSWLGVEFLLFCLWSVLRGSDPLKGSWDLVSKILYIKRLPALSSVKTLLTLSATSSLRASTTPPVPNQRTMPSLSHTPQPCVPIITILCLTAGHYAISQDHSASTVFLPQVFPNFLFSGMGEATHTGMAPGSIAQRSTCQVPSQVSCMPSSILLSSWNFCFTGIVVNAHGCA